MRGISDVRRPGSGRATAFLLTAVLLVGFTDVVAAKKPIISEVEGVEITARPIAGFDRQNVDRQRFGRLRWRGGLVLSSKTPEFGGWSGLVLDEDGSRLLAVSDAGAWLSANLMYDGTRPARLENARIGPLLAIGGKPLSRARDRDPEAVTLAAGNLSKGTLLIAFERNHRIGRFKIDGAGVSPPVEYLKLPAEARGGMDYNAGLESVSVLQGGRYVGSTIAFAERLTDERGHHTGWIWVKGEPRKLHLTDIREFDITDAAPLPDGGLLVLERRFRWTEGVKMRLRMLSPAEIAPGAVMEGEILLEADMVYQIDNMEGVAVHRGPNGETVITLISDDNFNPFLQRTLLLQFTLKEGNGEDDGRPQAAP